MICDLVFVSEEPGGRFRHRCTRCTIEIVSRYRDPKMRKGQVCGAALPQRGPGTELLRLFGELRITPKAGCDCEALRQEMDGLGVAGCRAQRSGLLGRLQANAALYGLADWAAAGWQAIAQGKPWTLGGLFDLAMERAEQQEQATAQSGPAPGKRRGPSPG